MTAHSEVKKKEREQKKEVVCNCHPVLKGYKFRALLNRSNRFCFDHMNASVLLDQTKMMLTYPQPAVFRPTFVSHGIVQQPVAQFSSFPLAITPTVLHTQLPQSSFPTVIPSNAASPPKSVIIPTSPSVSSTTKTPSPKSPSKQTCSSFSIDSILGKKETKTVSSDKVPVSPIANGSPRASNTNGLMYFYTPASSQPPFPFATAPRQYDHDLQRSPLGPLVISSGMHSYRNRGEYNSRAIKWHGILRV